MPSAVRLRRLLLILAILGIIVTAAILIARARFEPMMRDLVVRKLEERFQSDVDLEGFSVSLFPGITASGKGLVLRYKGRQDVPPLIAIQKFSFETGLFELLRTPKRVQRVRIDGFQIHVPPRGEKNDESSVSGSTIYPFIIDEIVADGTVLEILPKKAGKDPLTFDIHHLKLRSVGIDRPMRFQARLTNATPPGEINSTGEFGPWQMNDPGETPVSGQYTFRNADLSVFRGIAGILSSEGKYKGVLERIEVDGTTDTPDFKVSIGGRPVHLKTDFHAIVDGADGDTLLAPVKANFLNTWLVARGGVEGKPGVKGKTISLDVNLVTGRIEDLMRLAVKSPQPPLTGAVTFRTKFLLPAGDRDIADKLHLDGQFGIAAARFTSVNVREKVAELSRRGRGKPKDISIDSVASDLKGRFVLDNSVMKFSNLSFEAPGALVSLAGTYGLRNEELDFHGNLRLQARLSQTVTGIKSLLLKPVDPFFSKHGAGTYLPIKIVGNREKPEFGTEFRRRK